LYLLFFITSVRYRERERCYFAVCVAAALVDSAEQPQARASRTAFKKRRKSNHRFKNEIKRKTKKALIVSNLKKDI
jgi:hypothetical protein